MVKRDYGQLDELDESERKRERDKAKKLRKSRWWQRKRSTGICYYCDSQVGAAALTMDHLVPLSRGGRSTKTNLVPCCKPCNNRKKNLLPLEWDECKHSG